MTSTLVAVTFDAQDPPTVARFWARVELADPDGNEFSLRQGVGGAGHGG